MGRVKAASGGTTTSGARWAAPESMTVVEKPWGREIWWAVTDHYIGKIIEVKAGHALSLQYHEKKFETIYVQSGRARFTVDGTFEDALPGSAVTLPPHTVHRVEALEDLILFEVSTPHPDDVVRLEDRYGRSSGQQTRTAREAP